MTILRDRKINAIGEKVYRFLPFILGVILLWQSLSVNYDEHRFKHVVKVDGLGYYSYLPAVFIYQDKNFAFLDTVFAKHKPYSDGFQSIYSIQPDGKKLANRYSPGLAITQLPFWMVAHGYGKAIGQDRGFEVHYQLSALLSMVFCVFLGFFYLHRWMLLKKVNPFMGACVLIELGFGTNLFQYSTFDSSLTHATSFGLVCVLIFLFEKLKFSETKGLHYLITGLLCGLLVAIRPVNLLLLPFSILLFNFKELKILIHQYKKLMLLFLGVGLLILTLPLTWFILSGHWFLYSYGKEVFDFSNPHIFAFLFSYESGFFLYTPWLFFVMVLGAAGLLMKRRWFELGVYILSFTVIVYIFSCWWDWTYGCSLGCRPFVEFLPLFCIPFLNTIGSKKTLFLKIGTALILICCVYYNQILSYQYRNRIIDWCNVNEKAYWDVFLKTDKKYAFYTWPEWDFTQYKNQKTLDSMFISYEILPALPDTKYKHLCKWVVDPLNPQNHCLEIAPGKSVPILEKIPPLPPDGKRYYYTVRLKAMLKKSRTEDVFGLYFEQNGNYVDLLKSIFKKHIPETGKWVTYEFNGHTPLKEKGIVKMQVYVQSSIPQNLYIDDLEIRLKEYEEK